MTANKDWGERIAAACKLEGHLWTWTGTWQSIRPGEESWTCYRCGEVNRSKNGRVKPCLTCANPAKAPTCGFICGGAA